MNSNVDLVVIGTGSGAGATAYPCRAAGWSVTVVDSRPFGGTCQLRGCDPKKVLVGGAELVDWYHNMQGNGVPTSGLAIQWPSRTSRASPTQASAWCMGGPTSSIGRACGSARTR